MTLPAFKKLNPANNLQLQQVENNVAQAIAPLLKNPLLDSVAVSGVNLVANTPLAIAHKLGRQPQGWYPTDINANASVWRSDWSATTITLEASADVTLDLQVF